MFLLSALFLGEQCRFTQSFYKTDEAEWYHGHGAVIVVIPLLE